jgi:hypothetical protein
MALPADDDSRSPNAGRSLVVVLALVDTLTGELARCVESGNATRAGLVNAVRIVQNSHCSRVELVGAFSQAYPAVTT